MKYRIQFQFFDITSASNYTICLKISTKLQNLDQISIQFIMARFYLDNLDQTSTSRSWPNFSIININVDLNKQACKTTKKWSVVKFQHS